MKDTTTMPEEMAAMIDEASTWMDNQSDAFALLPELKAIRSDLLRRTVELSDAWFKFGCLIAAMSQGHSKQVQ